MYSQSRCSKRRQCKLNLIRATVFSSALPLKEANRPRACSSTVVFYKMILIHRRLHRNMKKYALISRQTASYVNEMQCKQNESGGGKAADLSKQQIRISVRVNSKPTAQHDEELGTVAKKNNIRLEPLVTRLTKRNTPTFYFRGSTTTLQICSANQSDIFHQITR